MNWIQPLRSPWLLLLYVQLLWVPQGSGQEVFRDFVYVPADGFFSELDPDTQRAFKEEEAWALEKERYVPHPLDLVIKNAIRAEMRVEYWGGHIGTSDQRVQVNDTIWLDLPQPVGTPGDPHCVYRTLLGNNSIPIPLEALNEGGNTFRFGAGPQICYNFDWGFYWIYGFTVRVYYSDQVSHPTGSVVARTYRRGPLQVEAVVTANGSPIAKVDFIGEYYDFDWDGDGIWREWQYQTRHGKLEQHIGTSTVKPWKVRWDTRWIADQDEPMRIRAIITDKDGMSYMSKPFVFKLPARKNRSVQAFHSKDVPEKFGVRKEGRLQCTIHVPENLSGVTSARLVVSSWSADSGEKGRHELLLNGVSLANNFGVHHDYSLDTLEVPTALLKPGKNLIEIYSNYLGHALEINWPGPMLLVEIEG